MAQPSRCILAVRLGSAPAVLCFLTGSQVQVCLVDNRFLSWFEYAAAQLDLVRKLTLR